MGFLGTILSFFAGDLVKKILAAVAIIIPAILPLIGENTIAHKILDWIWNILIAMGLISGGTSAMRSDMSRALTEAQVSGDYSKVVPLAAKQGLVVGPELSKYDPSKP